MARGKKKRTTNIKFGDGNTDRDGVNAHVDKQNLASAKSAIVPFMKTHSTKNPFDPNSPDVRTRTYQHPNERFRKFGTWDKI